MISRGERSGYRLVARSDGSWAVDGLPGLVVGPWAAGRLQEAARSVIAAVLDVPADAFDVGT